MEALIEKKISNLVQQQFPAFYNQEGPVFIEFVRAYYEWMEEEGKPIYYSRRFLDLRDIDETLEDFLYYFQKKYLYGIPFDVIINKRLLLKHVLDVYRSKSSIQCFKLLFKLIYNEDMEMYLPGRDVLRASDGTWKEPKYIEVSEAPLSDDLVGKKIRGITSGTTAIAESYIKEPINKNIVGSIYLSNIMPKGGSFEIGEKIVEDDLLSDPKANLVHIYSNSPTVIGSLDSIEIVNGGQDFKIGDILKIVQRDPTTNEVVSSGVEAAVKVTEIRGGRGQLNFSLASGGFGYTANTQTFTYNFDTDTTGYGARFAVNQLSNMTELTYNIDIVTSFLNKTLDATSYGFTTDPAANITSTIGSVLLWSSDFFGSVAGLSRIATGSDYSQNPYTFVRTSILSENLDGTITYNSATNIITGVGTKFEQTFEPNGSIYIQSNGTLSNTGEYHIVKSITSNTSLTLYGTPTKNSTASSIYKLAVNPISAHFLPTEYQYVEANVYAVPFAPSPSIIAKTKAINSGKGYIEGEQVILYRFGGLDDPLILNGGTNYVNGDLLLFYGGDPNLHGRGYVTTDGSGTITTVTMITRGSGYKSEPTSYVKSSTGSGASFNTKVLEYDTSVEVSGTINKGGIGKQQGFWTTTRGFLNSDKYIHDSYYYQDFSYEINTAVSLSKYRDILYNTFHIAGTEMFGTFLLNTKESIPMSILHESNVVISTL